MMLDDDVTEFTHLDTEEMHLVKDGANTFSPLLAKASADAVKALGELVKVGQFVAYCGDDGCAVCKVVFPDVEKAKLKAKQRNALPDSDFAIPEDRSYPIHDESHARNALSRVAQHGTDDEKKRVRAAVHRRYPDIGEEDAEKASQASMRASAVSPEDNEEQTRQNHAGRLGPVAGDPSAIQGPPPEEHYHQPTPPQHDGSGDTAPDKTLPRDEAASQTRAVEKQDGDDDEDDEDEETPSQQRREDAQAEKAKADAASKPGSPKWEGNDVALADEALEALAHATEVVQRFRGREKAEAVKAEISRATELLSDLVDGNNNHQIASKEIDMTRDELIALLDERDAKKAAQLAAAADASTDRETQSAEEAAKAATSDQGADDPAAEIAALKARIDHLENQPARPRPAINNTADLSVRPAVQRGGESVSGGDAIAQLRKARDEASTRDERQRLGGAVLVAGLAAVEAQRNPVHAARNLPVPLLAGQPAHAAAAAAASRP